jgi:GTP-binding protein
VDAPGYGYASDASKAEILQWGRLIEYYLKNTPQTDKQLIMVLVDAMHGLKETDGMLLNMLKKHKKSFMLVFTKCDRATEENIS